MRIPKKYEYKGQWLTQSQLAKLRGIPLGTLNRRLVNGMSVEDACETPVKTRSRPRGLPRATYLYRGKPYTLTRLAELAQMPIATMQSRLLRLGWSVEDAVNLPRDFTPREYRKMRDAKETN